MTKNKKGQLGMDVAKSFMLGLMMLLIMGVVVLIIMNSFGDMSLAYDSFTVTNETGGYINTTGYTLDSASVLGFKSVAITEAINATSNETILSGNYTVTSAGVVTNASTLNYADVLFSYTYDASNEIASVRDNSSSGIVDFFSNTSTWLALLGIVIIILIIAIVIAVVNQFGGVGGGRGSSGTTF